MPHMSAVFLCLAVAALALAGCAPALYPEFYWGTFPEQPPDYSPDYTYVPVVGRDGRTRMVLVPKACLVPDPTEPPLLGPHLPPGCANAYNLLRMAERKSDLVHGRPCECSTGFPAARAAPPPRPRRRERPRNTFMAPRAPWVAAFRVRQAANRRGRGLRARRRSPLRRGERWLNRLGRAAG